MTKEKISTNQFYAILFISRVMALFTFIAPQKTAFESGDRILVFIPFFIFEMLFSIPVFLITKRGETLPQTANGVSPKAAKAVSVIYFLSFSWSAAISVSRFELFMSTALFPDSDLTFFIILLLLICIYTAAKGIEPLGRCCTAVFVTIIISAAIILSVSIKDFDYTNLTPPFLSGISPFIQNGFSAAARTPELASMLFMLPCVNGNPKKSLFIRILFFGFFASGILGIIAGVTGAYGDGQMFQLYTLTVIADFGIFEKADALFTAVWVLCIIFRTVFYFILANMSVEQSFNKNNKYLTFSLSAAVVFISYLFLSKSVTVFSDVLASGINEAIYTLGMAVIPVLIYLSSVIKAKKQRKSSDLC